MGALAHALQEVEVQPTSPEELIAALEEYRVMVRKAPEELFGDQQQDEPSH